MKKRILLPDPKFGNVEVTRFVNNLMIDGKKSMYLKSFRCFLDVIASKKIDEDPLEVWENP